MTKVFFALIGVLSLGATDALAWAGGPFGNGDPSGILTERRGFYAATFTFKNGNGYGVFTPDAQFFGGLSVQGTGTSGNGAAFFDRGTLFTENSFNPTRSGNRSVFYYKGVTYVGSCMGYPDLEARTITGTANATSDDATTTSQQGQAGTQGSTLNSTAIIVQNNSGFILNAGWEGKITQTRPSLRFSGKGQISVLSPSGQSTLASLANQGYAGLIGAIVNSVNNANVGANFNPAVYTQAQAAIGAALVGVPGGAPGLEDFLSSGNADARLKEADVVKLRVRGSRRFF